MKRKAYKIVTDINDYGGYGIYSAESSGRAKTMVVNGLREAYYEATYSWIKSCKRAYNYDCLADKYSGCVAWKDEEDYCNIEGKTLE
jgi:hypothetical protein